jgi:hypothetical protein
MEQEDGTWEAFKLYFNPLVNRLTDEFKSVVNLYQNWEDDYFSKAKLANEVSNECTSADNTNIVLASRMVQQTLIRSFLETCTLFEFARYFSIYAHASPDFPELIYFHFNPEYAPWNSSIGKECNGLVLKPGKKPASQCIENSSSFLGDNVSIAANGNASSPLIIDPNVLYSDWCVVALPIPRVDRWDSSHAPKIDWKRVLVSELMDGQTATLFFYSDSWHVATDQTSNGSEIVHASDNVTFADLFWMLFWSCNVKAFNCDSNSNRGPDMVQEINSLLSEFRTYNFNFVLVHPFVKDFVSYEKGAVYLTRVVRLDASGVNEGILICFNLADSRLL